MSESARASKVVAVEYAPFPLDRENKTVVRDEERVRGLSGMRRARWLHWSMASVKQILLLIVRPLIVALGWQYVLKPAIGEKTWRLLYAAGVLSAKAIAEIRIWINDRVGRLTSVCQEGFNAFRRWVGRRVTVACLFSGVCLCLIVSSFYTLGLEVYLNGESIGFVSSPTEFAHAVENVSLRVSEILNYPYYPNPDVTYHYAMIDRISVFNQTEVEDQLFDQISDIKKLNLLSVDGVVVAASSDRAGLEVLLEDVLNEYDLHGTAESLDFMQDVRIMEQWTEAALERPLDEITDILYATSQARYEEVGEQDTLSEIARRNGLSEEDLMSLNGVADDLGDGDGDVGLPAKLLVQKPVSLLTVEASKYVQHKEEIPYTTARVKDDTIYEGESKLRVKGVPGVSLVTTRVVYHNGEEFNSTEEGRETILEPVEEIIAEGAKERPPKAPTGRFIRPYWGRLTSTFGYRSLFGGSMHQGIDLAGPIGDPIVAADGGTVIFAGTKSGYGYCVMISHGSGLSTLYGHCSKLLVSEGQAVAKGEQIAKVGNTGRSTGPHVHFEIRVNGTPVNPLKYLD